MIGPLLDDGGDVPGTLLSSFAHPTGASGATLQVKNDGTYSATGQSDANWVTPATSGVAAFYQIRAEVVSDAGLTGTFDEWLDLSSTRTWTQADNGGTSQISISIREKATQIVRMTDTDVQLIDAT